MKIIYRGGYNKLNESSIKSSMFYEYSEAINIYSERGKKVAVVTFAKPNNFWDQILIDTLGHLPEIIDTSTPNNTSWDKYDLILIPGGHDLKLKSHLLDYGFAIRKLKGNAVVIGDSAGATVMGKYFCWKREDGSCSIEEGLNPDSNLFVVPHINNPNYVNKEMLEIAKKFCAEKNLNLLTLKENQAKLFDNNTISDFDINAVLV